MISMRKLGSAIVVCSALSFMTGTASAATAWVDPTNIEWVRPYSDGKLHIRFTNTFTCSLGNTNTMIVQGSGLSNVLSTALAAQLSGRSVTIEYDNAAGVGQYCALGYIRLNN